MEGLTFAGICMRLLCAMIVGLVIGTEREFTHRPAGMRTHILVALGACSVMITGELIFIHYSALGATPDPARLGAQVITGVGFLGAGTILREGINVKGLTTAASLWTVACLGLAAGAGYYVVALVGMIFVFITLTVFESIQNKLMGNQGVEKFYSVITDNIAASLEHIHQNADSLHATLNNLRIEAKGNDMHLIRFRLKFSRAHKKGSKKFLEQLAQQPEMLQISVEDEYTEVKL